MSNAALDARFLLSCAAVSVIMLAAPALSEEYTISTTVSETNGGYTLDGGDKLTITSTGAIVTSKNGTNGISATGPGNTIVVEGIVTTNNLESKGIYVDASGGIGGNVTISGGGAVTTNHTRSNAVEVLARDGTIDIDLGEINATGITKNDRSGGVSATMYGNGTVNITVDDVTVKTKNSFGIYVDGKGDTAVTIEAGDVTTTEAVTEPISVRSVTGSLDITTGNVSIVAANKIAITAKLTGTGGTSGNITLDVGNISGVSGAGMAMDVLTAGNGSIDISAGDVTVASSDGIRAAVGNTGNVVLNVGTVTSTSSGGRRAISATTKTGNVEITTKDVSTTGGNSLGIYARSETGDISLTANDVKTTGAVSTAIDFATITGNVTILVNEVSTQGNSTTAIRSRVTNGNNNVTAAKVTTGGNVQNGDSDGIELTTSIGDNTAVIDYGETKSRASEIIYAITNSGTNTLTLKSGLTLGEFSDAVEGEVTGTGKNVVHLGDITTKGDSAEVFRGIVANGDNQVYLKGDIATQGVSARGIWITTTTGDNAIEGEGTIVTSGAKGDGVRAETGTGNNVVNLASVKTSGESAIGIKALADTGNNEITISTLETTGAFADAIAASVSVLGDNIVVLGDVSTQGEGAEGFAGSTVEGNNELTVNGTVSTLGLDARGLWAIASKGGNLVDVTGTITTAGIGAEAIDVLAIGGDNRVTLGGTITTKGEGATGVWTKTQNGNNVVVVNGHVATQGKDAMGVWAKTEGGDNTITVNGTITTTGAGAHGVFAELAGTGSNVINVYGTVITTGEGAHAIYADPPASGTQNTVNVYGTVRAEGNSAYAVKFDDTEYNTLNLYGTANIDGPMDLFYLDELNLQTTPGYSKVWDFSGLPDGVTPNVMGSAYVYDADTGLLATVDSMAVGGTTGMLADFSDMTAGLFVSNPKGNAIWMRSTAGVTGLEMDGLPEQELQTRGLAMGATVPVGTMTSLGVMVGYGDQSTQAESFGGLPQTSTVEGLFGSVTAQQSLNGWVLAGSLAAGRMDHANSGYTNGAYDPDTDTYEVAEVTSEFSSWWLNPRLSAAYEIPMGALSIVPTLEASYAAQFVDGYSQTGGTTPLTVGDHMAAVGQLRTELAAHYAIGAATLSAMAGYVYRKDMGDAVPIEIGEMSGQAASAFTGGSSTYAGMGLNLDDQTMSVSLDARGTYRGGVLGASLSGHLSVRY